MPVAAVVGETAKISAIELAFEAGEVEGMTPEDIKQYIRYIGDRRL